MTELRLVRASGIQLAYRESRPPGAPPLLLLHEDVLAFPGGSGGPADPPG